VRCAQDIINPNTDHADIMLLSGEDGVSSHQYMYARVLGIYHINTIYSGPGMVDYCARRMEFLWVRWFARVDDEPVQNGWVRRRLDCLQFPQIDPEEAFRFVDPAHVLRGSLMQSFTMGRQYTDGAGLSKCARDVKDWGCYYVNRWVITNSFDHSIASAHLECPFLGCLTALLTET
jgi:hypothetical protein